MVRPRLEGRKPSPVPTESASDRIIALDHVPSEAHVSSGSLVWTQYFFSPLSEMPIQIPDPRRSHPTKGKPDRIWNTKRRAGNHAEPMFKSLVRESSIVLLPPFRQSGHEKDRPHWGMMGTTHRRHSLGVQYLEESLLAALQLRPKEDDLCRLRSFP